ncbi:hypothetical protein [Aliihoeflea sp. 2WW]|uniref:hypothetical protein n=1 Tax=Aliihoeflea sp. 2WW TaxID=1381123 RepID=UPI0012679DB6|nr:hypothetical protein [Aliihoeflea sp. 2WW]
MTDKKIPEPFKPFIKEELDLLRLRAENEIARCKSDDMKGHPHSHPAIVVNKDFLKNLDRAEKSLEGNPSTPVLWGFFESAYNDLRNAIQEVENSNEKAPSDFQFRCIMLYKGKADAARSAISDVMGRSNRRAEAKALVEQYADD